MTNHPGEYVRQIITEAGLSIGQAANAISIQRPHLNNIVNAKANVTRTIAYKLDALLGTDTDALARDLIDRQAAWDWEQDAPERLKALDEIEHARDIVAAMQKNRAPKTIQAATPALPAPEAPVEAPSEPEAEFGATDYLDTEEYRLSEARLAKIRAARWTPKANPRTVLTFVDAARLARQVAKAIKSGRKFDGVESFGNPYHGNIRGEGWSWQPLIDSLKGPNRFAIFYANNFDDEWSDALKKRLVDRKLMTAGMGYDIVSDLHPSGSAKAWEETAPETYTLAELPELLDSTFVLAKMKF